MSGPSAVPAGEVYGEEGWREEELSASELDVDAPEIGQNEPELDSQKRLDEDEGEAEW